MQLTKIIQVLMEEQRKAKVFTDEADLIKIVSEYLPLIDECCIIRQEAIHRSGIPDFICCFKGRFIAIELKDNEGVQSSLQIKWQEKIEGASGIYILADSLYPICNIFLRVAQGKI